MTDRLLRLLTIAAALGLGAFGIADPSSVLTGGVAWLVFGDRHTHSLQRFWVVGRQSGQCLTDIVEASRDRCIVAREDGPAQRHALDGEQEFAEAQMTGHGPQR